MDPFDFSTGTTNPETFPTEALADAAARAVRSHGVRNDRLDGLLIGDVEPDGGAANLVGHGRRARFVPVDHDERSRPFGVESLDERRADPARSTSDDRNFVC